MVSTFSNEGNIAKEQFLKLLLSAVRIYCLELGGPWLLLILFERFSIQCFQHTGCTHCATPKLFKKVLHIGYNRCISTDLVAFCTNEIETYKTF